MKYDVIVVGAGIAGISSAINLKKLNSKLKILVIDKSEFPRNKLCAGYLTTKSAFLLSELGVEIDTIDYNIVKGISIIYKNKTRIKANNHGLFCQKLVDRTVLDYELFKKLKENNIDVKENAKITDFNKDESTIDINNIKYAYENIIFADGEAGYSSRFNNEKKKYFAMQINFKSVSKPKIDMFLGITKKGYGWCASSGEYINIGFCDIYNKNEDYMKVFKKLVNDLGYRDQLDIKPNGFFVPYGLKKNKVIGNSVYLVGDAAGTVDPLTLAGVSYALLSGKYAAQSIFMGESSYYLKYLKKVRFKYSVLKILTFILYNPLTLLFGIRIGGYFFGRFFSYLLDKFILNKNGSFHQ